MPPVPAAARPAAPERRWRCGSGDFLCPNFLPKRGLCPSCAERLEARVGPLESGRPARAGAKPKVTLPPAQRIDPADVFDAGDRPRVPAAERAEHMARWIHRVGCAVRRADACRLAGVDPMNGSGKNVLSVAEERGWITRGAVGAVLPGQVAPST
jgi:hypothetical protein